MNETVFKRLPIFKFDSSNAVVRMNGEESYFCNLISACSEVFNLTSLNINNAHDVIKEATPIIRYLISWTENHLENNIIDFKIKFHFYEDIPEEHYQFGPDGIIAFNFKFEEDGDILTKIKTLIDEELEDSSDITFPSISLKLLSFTKLNVNTLMTKFKLIFRFI